MNCGAVYSQSDNAFVFKVGKFLDINEKLVHSIQGVKQLDYQDFCEIATLID